MKNRKQWMFLGGLAVLILALGGAAYWGKHKLDEVVARKKALALQEENRLREATKSEVDAKKDLTKTQESLSLLAEKLSRNLQAEEKLRLSMISQLQTFESLLEDLRDYSLKIENDMAILNRISDGQFQEDVKLQAALYKGKKPSIVADHLSDFHANRAGAILAHMKEKEASDVLDVWAVSTDIKVVDFYRQVMAAYLDNKRYLLNPKLYQTLKQREDKLETTAYSQESTPGSS